MNLRSYNLFIYNLFAIYLQFIYARTIYLFTIYLNRTAPAHLLDWTINRAPFPLRQVNIFFFFQLHQCMVSSFKTQVH